ncbi:MAG: acyl carrier protein [Clostridia bacterium]|nr:acyl carrier protein [Clostridia bacterium]
MMDFNTFLKFLGEEFEFDTEGIQPETTFEDINFDEFDLIELVMSVEDKCNIEMPDEALKSFKTVGDFAAYLESKF